MGDGHTLVPWPDVSLRASGALRPAAPYGSLHCEERPFSCEASAPGPRAMAQHTWGHLRLPEAANVLLGKLKRPELYNRRGVVFHQDSANNHTQLRPFGIRYCSLIEMYHTLHIPLRLHPDNIYRRAIGGSRRFTADGPSSKTNTSAAFMPPKKKF